MALLDGQMHSRSEIVHAIHERHPELNVMQIATVMTAVLNQHPLLIARAMGGVLRTETHHLSLGKRRDTIVLPWRDTIHD